MIPSGSVKLPAIFGLPEHGRGAVLFAHGSGSGRFSPRNNAVAHVLQEAGLATLLADLLSEQEAQDRRYVFDIGLLARRLMDCTCWAQRQDVTQGLPIGYFGASTGAGAALVAAAQLGAEVRAVVSRGGRPDLAKGFLKDVRSPILLIVGGNDEPVIGLNEQALAQIQSVRELIIVSGATHLFEEPGALEQVAQLARDWFLRYLPARAEGV
jgi:putative phosphoribosyl transferase